MADNIARWRDEHFRFATLLGVVERQLDRFHSGEQPDYALALDVMRYMNGYPDRCHHPQEDVAFERVAAREPAHAGAIAALLEEHEEIDRSGERLVQLFEEVLDDAVLSREQVEQPGRAYIRLLRDHMRREEEFFERAASVLDASDWAAIERAVPLESDPLVAAEGNEDFASLRALVSRAAAGRIPISA